jgi:vancomycin permeability regulator SanA
MYRGRPSQVFRARLDHALELYHRKLAPQIMTTGGAGGEPVFTEGGVGRSYLIGRGVPSEAIIVETEGESTVHSTTLAGEIMRRMGLNSAIVVSDGYHIYRVKRMLETRNRCTTAGITSSRPWDTCSGAWGWACRGGWVVGAGVRPCHLPWTVQYRDRRWWTP